MRNLNRRILIVGGSVLALAAGGTGIALATGAADDDGSQQPIRGAELQKASAAALAETGGGQVTETEVGDEEGYYEVEVTRADGSQVDVHLDRGFGVIDSSADGAGDAGEAGDRD
jgi:uncharacterized membrane protein YkoI